METNTEEILWLVCIFTFIGNCIIACCICGYTNYKTDYLENFIKTSINDIKYYYNSKNINFAEALRNIEELIDPKPNECYTDRMCYDVANYCIANYKGKEISNDIIMKHFCIGFTRTSSILHQLVIRNICRRLENGNVAILIDIEQLNQMAREGKV